MSTNTPTDLDPALAQRIAQWEKMAAEAPDEMAFFSLGSAYREAGLHEQAADAFRRALGHDGQMSRAWQHLGDALLKLGKDDEAGDALRKGYVVAVGRGDAMPQRAMEAMLKKLGRELPQVESAAEKNAKLAEQSGGRMIIDRKTGQPQPKLAGPPMRGPMGQFIFAHVGQVTWNQWIGQGTKVINELRLDFSNPAHQDLYDQHMLEWLGISEDEVGGA